jgi:hypothetical protein
MLPLQGTPLGNTFCSIRSIFSSFLNALNLSLAADTECHLSEKKLLGAGATHPALPKLICESMLDQFLMAAV